MLMSKIMEVKDIMKKSKLKADAKASAFLTSCCPRNQRHRKRSNTAANHKTNHKLQHGKSPHILHL